MGRIKDLVIELQNEYGFDLENLPEGFSVDDYLEMKSLEKLTIIVGNPPFQNTVVDNIIVGNPPFQNEKSNNVVDNIMVGNPPFQNEKLFCEQVINRK